jgi:hypothetical protein
VRAAATATTRTQRRAASARSRPSASARVPVRDAPAPDELRTRGPGLLSRLLRQGKEASGRDRRVLPGILPSERLLRTGGDARTRGRQQRAGSAASRRGDCSYSSIPAASRQLGGCLQSAPFVAEQKSRPALLLVVHSGSVTRPDRHASFHAGSRSRRRGGPWDEDRRGRDPSIRCAATSRSRTGFSRRPRASARPRTRRSVMTAATRSPEGRARAGDRRTVSREAQRALEAVRGAPPGGCRVIAPSG